VAATGTVVGLSAVGPTGVAVEGTGATGTAIAASTTGEATTVKVTNNATGAALEAVTQGNPGRATAAIVGNSQTGRGVLGLSTEQTAVEGRSRLGRGASFSGALAQVHLAPGSSASHPGTGETGDLYCDRSGRLWFCKTGGTHPTWKRLA